MKAIEISQQKELTQVITEHIKTSAVYCFGSNDKSYSLNRKVYPDHGKQKENVHLYLLVFVSETIENASNDISDKIKTKSQGALTATILLHHVQSLKKPWTRPAVLHMADHAECRTFISGHKQSSVFKH